MIACVILNTNSNVLDNLYDYVVPEHLENKIKIGQRVKVGFGKGNKKSEAFVYDLKSESEFDKLKEILDIIDEYSYFDKDDAEIIDFMRHRYFCSYSSAIKVIIPPGVSMKFTKMLSLNIETVDEAKAFCSNSMVADKVISLLETYGVMSIDELRTFIDKNNLNSVINDLIKRKYINAFEKESNSVTDTKKKFLRLTSFGDDLNSVLDKISKRYTAGRRVVKYLQENGDVELSDLLVAVSTSKSTVDRMEKLGYVESYYVVQNKSYLSDNTVKKTNTPRLNKYQQISYDSVKNTLGNGKKNVFLLHGVTGSGKTEVYLSLIQSAVSNNLNSILLVPEISLTPQMVEQIYSRFGNNVAVIHSKLTSKQRFDEWKRIKNGEVQIAVGARSAIFAPFKEIGLIIIDEEHEMTYKSEMSPKYNTVEIARFIANQKKSTLILASATPSVESYYKAKSGAFTLLEMPERVNNNPLPDVKIADMRCELSDGNMSIFSKTLFGEIEKNLKNNEQTILFLNRRGFSGFVSCRSCGYVLKCPNCNVSLTYHKSINKMVCHYCDYKTAVPNSCPSCSSKHIRFFGIGTEKVVDEVKKAFAHAKVIRMDADTTSGKESHEKLLTQFREKNADILVGTQMITKGLDFENVTLVGVIAADMSLNMDDYRASERTFDLITQVIGRAGRSKKIGRAIIQTYNPDDEVIIQSSKQNYINFYNNEIMIRRTMMYPPFSEFINIQFSSSFKNKALDIANKMYDELKIIFESNNMDVLMYNVCEAPIFKINNKYRYHFLLKTIYKKDIYDCIHDVYNRFKTNKSGVSVGIDVNPISVY